MSAALDVAPILREYGGAARATMARYLPSADGADGLEPRRWLYDLVADYPRRGGRSLRPSLCIATARAFGGSIDEALGTAASIELFHNALLIHDDIEDESEERRGQPALHLLHGVPLALNAGDALLLAALQPLLDNCGVVGADVAWRVLDETNRMARETVEGQAIELGWRNDNAVDVNEDAYLEMVLKKTCWFGMIYPARVGAIIGARGAVDDAWLDELVRYGFLLGAAFQVQDDLLNLVGDHASYGKELGGDILEGKRTLMLIRLLAVCGAHERERIVATLSAPRRERADDDVRYIRARMDHHGCIDYARQFAHGLAGAAQHAAAGICDALPPSRDRDFIARLPTWVLERA